MFYGENPLEVIKQMGYEEPIEYMYHEWYPMSDTMRAKKNAGDTGLKVHGTL